jgi:hypothetical protein
MSMIMTISVLPDEVLAAFEKHPTIINLAEEAEGDLEDMRDPGDWATQAEVDAFFAEPGIDELESCFEAEYEIDQWWAGVHYLLSGENPTGGASARKHPRPPLARVLEGDLIVDEPIATHGVKSAEARALAALLKGVRRAELVERFDVKAMMAARIYPECWEEEDAAEVIEIAWEVRSIFIDAAKHGFAIMTRIS